MLLVLRPLLHPLAQERDLLGLQSLARFRRRHAILGILRLDFPHQRTLVGLPCDDGGAELIVRHEGELSPVEP